jgi:hypothetical protein
MVTKHQLAPHEQPPKSISGDPSKYRPPENQITWHTVLRNQTLSQIAALHHVPVDKLIALNFPGSVDNGRVIPAVVNWYLHHHEGFRCPTTADGQNRRFEGGEKIAIPKPATRIAMDELLIYSSEEYAFSTLGEKFEKENPGKNRAEAASNAAHISGGILDRYRDLKQISFYTHGNVGYVHFPRGGITRSNVSLLTPSHNQLFQGIPRAVFIGCNVGEGPQGREFLIAAGQALFKGGGGIIGATTVANIFGRWGLIDARMPLWGDLRVIHLDAAGKVVTERLF